MRVSVFLVYFFFSGIATNFVLSYEFPRQILQHQKTVEEQTIKRSGTAQGLARLIRIAKKIRNVYAMETVEKAALETVSMQEISIQLHSMLLVILNAYYTIILG